MNKKEWKTILESQIKYDHDYLPSFQTSIMILSEILEERDNVHDEYIKTGAKPIIEFTSDRGAVNPKPNPLLKQWQELNTSALSYLRELGLTAAGLRKLQGQIPKDEIKNKPFSLLDESKPWDDGMTEEEKQFFSEDGVLIDPVGYHKFTGLPVPGEDA